MPAGEVERQPASSEFCAASCWVVLRAAARWLGRAATTSPVSSLSITMCFFPLCCFGHAGRITLHFPQGMLVLRVLQPF